MFRRIDFFGWLASALLGVVLLSIVARVGVIQAQAIARVPGVTGNYHGFIQAHFNYTLRGSTFFNVDQQFNRRFLGTLDMRIVDFSSPALFDEYNIDVAGTIPQNDFYVGTGRGIITHGGTGQSIRTTTVFRGDFAVFEADAAVTDPQFHFQPALGRRENQFASIALRDFQPGLIPPPDITGSWVGTFESDGPESIRLTWNQFPDPPLGETSFVGHLVLEDRPFMHEGVSYQSLEYDLRGTINEDGRFLLIGQGVLGRLFAEGDTSEGAFPLSAEASLQLLFNSGEIEVGTFEIVRDLPVVD